MVYKHYMIYSRKRKCQILHLKCKVLQIGKTYRHNVLVCLRKVQSAIERGLV